MVSKLRLPEGSAISLLTSSSSARKTLRIVHILDLTMCPRRTRRRTLPALTSTLGPDRLLGSHSGCQEKNEKRLHRGDISTGRAGEVTVNKYKDEFKGRIRMSVARRERQEDI